MSDIWLAEGRGGLTRVTPNQPVQRTGARDARTRPLTATFAESDMKLTEHLAEP